MVDYLEKAWERADVLLEQMRRSERGLFELAGGSGQGSGDIRGESENVSQGIEMVYDAEKHVNETIACEPGDREGVPAEMVDAVVGRNKGTEDEPGLARRPEEDGETGEGQRRDAPLAARLERLDRAVSVSSGGLWSRDKAGRQRLETSALARSGTTDIQVPEVREAGWPGIGEQSSSGRATDWVEQADRAFRRDSRRYDGGFYLY